MIYVGIDIASEKHDYFMLHHETGAVFSRSSITIPNSESGYKKLHSDIPMMQEYLASEEGKKDYEEWQKSKLNKQQNKEKEPH